MNGAVVQNCVVVVSTATAVLGLYAMSHSMNALWAMLMLFGMVSWKSTGQVKT
jgi:hypothetical protein